MRPQTLAEAVERIVNGEPQDAMLAEFVDTFDLEKTSEGRYSSIEQAPRLTGDNRLDALVGAIAEYLAHQHELPSVPGWAFSPERSLEHAWHASPFADDGAREYLTFSSPAEFASRNIFTEEQPLRRARGPHPMEQ